MYRDQERDIAINVDAYLNQEQRLHQQRKQCVCNQNAEARKCLRPAFPEFVCGIRNVLTYSNKAQIDNIN